MKAMDEPVTLEQGKELDCLVRALGDELFTMDDDPVADLPVAQLRVCGALYGGPRQMSALGRELGVSCSAMTQIADRLERAGLVSRVAERTDRRIRCLQLTRRGKNIMRLHEETRIQRVLAALDRLDPKMRKRILAAFQTFVSACAAVNREHACATTNDGRRGS
jgi:DNA-binding MarR family transcriptional regulator